MGERETWLLTYKELLKTWKFQLANLSLFLKTLLTLHTSQIISFKISGLNINKPLFSMITFLPLPPNKNFIHQNSFFFFFFSALSSLVMCSIYTKYLQIPAVPLWKTYEVAYGIFMKLSTSSWSQVLAGMQLTGLVASIQYLKTDL